MKFVIDLFAEVWAINSPATFASVCLMIYFLGVAVLFIPSPVKNAKNFSMQPIDNAGITEIRVYYGGISLALCLFLGYLLLVAKNPLASLVGGLFFATTVFVTRFIFTFVDKGWKCAYTKLAIPCEALFVIALWTCYIIQKNMY